jgi:hypothetical protein
LRVAELVLELLAQEPKVVEGVRVAIAQMFLVKTQAEAQMPKLLLLV